MGEFDPPPRTCVCLRKVRQFLRFINENRNKNRQKAFLNEKFINMSFMGLRNKRVQLLPRGDQLASDFKELRINFEANLFIFQKFCKNCSEYEELVNYNSIYLFIYLLIYLFIH